MVVAFHRPRGVVALTQDWKDTPGSIQSASRLVNTLSSPGKCSAAGILANIDYQPHHSLIEEVVDYSRLWEMKKLFRVGRLPISDRARLQPRSSQNASRDHCSVPCFQTSGPFLVSSHNYS
jgi:hypothetical protein